MSDIAYLIVRERESKWYITSTPIPIPLNDDFIPCGIDINSNSCILDDVNYEETGHFGQLIDLDKFHNIFNERFIKHYLSDKQSVDIMTNFIEFIEFLYRSELDQVVEHDGNNITFGELYGLAMFIKEITKWVEIYNNNNMRGRYYNIYYVKYSNLYNY